MNAPLELDMFIPADVTIDDDGVIATADSTKVYKFNNGVDRFLSSFTGMGLPPIEYIRQRGPYQHGSTVLDFRLQARTIQYIHRRRGCSREDYWSNRSDLINLVRPNRWSCNFEPGRLRKIQPDGTVRDINAIIEFGPVFGARNIDKWDEWAFTEALRFVCDDPTWFDPNLQSAVWELTNLENLIFYGAALDTPTPVPVSPGAPDWSDRLVFEGDDLDSGGIWFGEDSLYQTLDVTYTGTWFSFPTIKMTGPISQPQVWNLTLGEKIELTYDIPAGDTVTIDLSFGNKTVIDNHGENLIGTVTTDSTLSTFRLAPDPEATGGVNQLQVIGDDAVIGETQVTIEWFTRYIGI
jgi:hypothetical protein